MITPATTPAGWIVYNDQAIFGFGATEADAWTDWEREMAAAQIEIVTPEEHERLVGMPLGPQGSYTMRDDYAARPATERLIREVEERGGAIEWHLMHGIACTQADLED